MRVLLVTNTYPPADVSGVGTLAFELAERLGRAGHVVRVLTRRPPHDDVHAVAVGGPKLLFPLLAALRFLAMRSGWDLVHVHESDGAAVALALRALRSFGRPAGAARLVATLQVSYVEERRAVRPVLADGVVVSRPTFGERVFALLRAPLLAALGRLTARLADVVIAPSRATAEELRRDYGAGEVVVIPNGVALPASAAGPAGGHGHPGGPVIAFAGRLRTRKAAAVLVSAMPRVLERIPGCRLMLLGGGEQEAAIGALVRRLGIGQSLELPGILPRAEVVRRLAGADVFCLPSTYEGMPLAILEAMSLGLPVVATAVSGNPEAVEHGVTGLLVPPESATALADALVTLLADPELRLRMGEAGRRRVEELFAIERGADRHLALLAP